MSNPKRKNPSLRGALRRGGFRDIFVVLSTYAQSSTNFLVRSNRVLPDRIRLPAGPVP